MKPVPPIVFLFLGLVFGSILGGIFGALSTSAWMVLTIGLGIAFLLTYIEYVRSIQPKPISGSPTHLINGRFQSDKYPTCPPGKVPLSTRDPMAQDLLLEYARRRRHIDRDFSEDLVTALQLDGLLIPVRWDEGGPHTIQITDDLL